MCAVSLVTGLQPTLEQMKLLALMSDYRVTGTVLRAFWSDACDRDFGVDPYKDQTYTYTPETVLRTYSMKCVRPM